MGLVLRTLVAKQKASTKAASPRAARTHVHSPHIPTWTMGQPELRSHHSPRTSKLGRTFAVSPAAGRLRSQNQGLHGGTRIHIILVRPLLGAVANNFIDDICSRICDRGSVAKCPAIVP